MEVFETYSGAADLPPLSLALGYFDGVHLGHCVVVKNAVDFARKNGLKSAVVTFKEPPACFFSKQPLKNILPLSEKMNLLEKLGIDYVFVLNFDESLAKMTSMQYLEDVLIKYFKPKSITTGFNHTFGFNKHGCPKFLKDNQDKFRYKYYEIPPISHENKIISSTAIRSLLEQANFVTASKLLGYDFYIKGKIIKGQQLGRKIGFPTANLLYPCDIVNIPQGVYAAYVDLDGQRYDSVLNYGKKPTVDSSGNLLLEAHLLDFDADVYSKKAVIAPLKKIRNEQKFCSLSDLKLQISRDIVDAREFFTSRTQPRNLH